MTELKQILGNAEKLLLPLFFQSRSNSPLPAKSLHACCIMYAATYMSTFMYAKHASQAHKNTYDIRRAFAFLTVNVCVCAFCHQQAQTNTYAHGFSFQVFLSSLFTMFPNYDCHGKNDTILSSQSTDRHQPPNTVTCEVDRF